MISRYVQSSGFSPATLSALTTTPFTPEKPAMPVATGDQFVPQSVPQPHFGKVSGRGKVFIVLAAGAGVLVFRSCGPETLPTDAKTSYPHVAVALGESKPIPVTVQVDTKGLSFVFTGNVKNAQGQVNQDLLIKCVRQVLSKDDTLKSDVYQLNSQKEVVLCQVNEDGSVEMGMISKATVQALKAPK